MVGSWFLKSRDFVWAWRLIGAAEPQRRAIHHSPPLRFSSGQPDCSRSWRVAVVEVALRSGSGGAGSVWHQVVRGVGNHLVEADYRVTACERPRRYAFELIAGPTAGTGEYTLAEKAPLTTTVTLTIGLRPRGFLLGFTGLVSRQMAAELDSLDRLRDLLEGGAGDGG